MSICFIADLHLSPQRPELTELFKRFLQQDLKDVEELYILGDLFDAWVGDSAFSRMIAGYLRQLKARHITLYFMPGNRDFLIDRDYAAEMGAQLLSDPCVIDLYGVKTLLKHGDDLCADRFHLVFRRISRYASVKKAFLSLPLNIRQAFARAIRGVSRWRNPRPLKRSDVSLPLVQHVMKAHHVRQLIHGHTHQPGIHDFQYQHQWYRRMVLSDWHEKAHNLNYYLNREQIFSYLK